MSQWGFYFNQSRCVGCKACTLACKNWNDLRRGDAGIYQMVLASYTTAEGGMEKKSTYRNPETNDTNYKEYSKYYMKENWRQVTAYERGAVNYGQGNTLVSNFDRRYLSISCNHCDEPVCVKICPMGIITKNAETGAVLTSTEYCISCGRCKEACPWSCPQYYDEGFASYPLEDPRRPKMTKCTMCYDRITTEPQLKPACVAACWNRALDAGPMDELIERYGANKKLEDFADDYVSSMDIHTKPNILFKSK